MSNNSYFPAHVQGHPDVIALVGADQTMMANEKDYLATRVSYKLDLRGPSVNVVTACSTSLVAVHQAVQSLLTYQCDMALAGGASVKCPQKRGYLYQEGFILSPDGHCRAFDARAQGTVFSNGVGVVVLKRLADARADRDHVYAVVRGSAINNDGSAKVSFAAPSVDGQAEVIAMAQAVAGVEPGSISYVETHGTGTALGDPIEIAGLTQSFRAGSSGEGFCAIGSLKTNIGHLDAAAGVAGLIKTTLALQHEAIPASLHFETPNPELRPRPEPLLREHEPARVEARGRASPGRGQLVRRRRHERPRGAGRGSCRGGFGSGPTGAAPRRLGPLSGSVGDGHREPRSPSRGRPGASISPTSPSLSRSAAGPSRTDAR